MNPYHDDDGRFTTADDRAQTKAEPHPARGEVFSERHRAAQQAGEGPARHARAEGPAPETAGRTAQAR